LPCTNPKVLLRGVQPGSADPEDRGEILDQLDEIGFRFQRHVDETINHTFQQVADGGWIELLGSDDPEQIFNQDAFFERVAIYSFTSTCSPAPFSHCLFLTAGNVRIQGFLSSFPLGENEIACSSFVLGDVLRTNCFFYFHNVFLQNI
jgi:hypothetical protein